MPAAPEPASAGRGVAVAAAGVVAVAASALLVAAAIRRAPPDFAALPPTVVVRDAAARPLWVVRVAPLAHEIAVDARAAMTAAPPAGHAYQLWLATPAGPRSLGLLPHAGRAIIPEIPAVVARLAAGGELLVSLETAGGSRRAGLSGPIVFRAAIVGPGGASVARPSRKRQDAPAGRQPARTP